MIPSVSEEDYAALLDIVRHGSNPGLVRRAQIVLALADGRGPAEISRILRCSESTVGRVAARYQDFRKEGLTDRRTLKVSVLGLMGILSLLVTLLCSPPGDHGWMRSTWSCELLGLEVAKRLHIAIHRSYITRLVHVAGFRFKRPRPTVISPDPRKEEILAELAALKETLPAEELLFYEDEMDVHLNPTIGPMWMPKGVQWSVVTPGINVKNYVAGAMDHRTGQLTWVKGDHKNSLLFCALCKTLLQNHPEAPKIHLICDQSITHFSKITKKELAPYADRLAIHFLPTYSPEENPIERVWEGVHADVTRNHTAKSIGELIAKVDAHLTAASPFPGHHPSLAPLVTVTRVLVEQQRSGKEQVASFPVQATQT